MGQDQYTLGMDIAAEVGFPLNVDHLSAAETRRRSDPRRLAERKITEVDHRKRIDFTDGLTFNNDSLNIPFNTFIIFFLYNRKYV